MSTNTKHTPGPWIVCQDEGENVWRINGIAECGFLTPQDCKLAEVFSVGANASLISAAPDLLSALETILRAYEDEGGGSFQMDAVNAARAAIAKAKKPRPGIQQKPKLVHNCTA